MLFNNIKYNHLYIIMDGGELKNNWCYYIHLQNTNDWTIESYHKIMNIKNLNEAKSLFEYIGDEILKKALIFVMKGNIEPMWEAEENKNGGSFSLKIHNKDMYRIWKVLYYKLLGETLCKEPSDMQYITGISNSPKKTFTIIKIWINTCDVVESIMFNLDFIELKNCIFKKHNQD